ncbi:MAG: glycine betaine ABC transporter substrate-binding protein [Ignavibacteriaceae bacterium]
MKKLFIIFILLVNAVQAQQVEIKAGSKKFTESVILAEIITQLAEYSNKNGSTVHLKELGGTAILWNALLNGEIDIYPEYTGTIREEILSGRNISDDESLKIILDDMNIGISKPLGFNNTYALGMKKEKADELNINSISDLKKHTGLVYGFSNEFIDRKDGWRNLRKAYDLTGNNVTGLEHDLAYRGLESGAIDILDLYSTDAEIEYYDIKVLEDDLNFFPEYNAVLLYRKDLAESSPGVLESVLRIENSIPESLMIKMNADVKLKGLSESAAASAFIRNTFFIRTEVNESSFWDRIIKTTGDHLFLVLISLSGAIIISIPLGIAAYRFKKFNKIILGSTGVIQTIPSLALLVFMIPLLGIGTWPAVAALFLYSLLPVVRNTFTGLEGIPGHIKESAEVLGISSFSKLWLIELPLASTSILAGIKTSAVINVGTATLGALIGAGGYGQPILTGIRLDNTQLILEGAVPAALLAILVQMLFDFLEKFLVPKGLKIKAE